MQSNRQSRGLLRELGFSLQIFKNSNIKFHEHPSSEIRVSSKLRDGWTEKQRYRHDKSDSRFSRNADAFKNRETLSKLLTV
jgi:hypothetical protein